MKAHRLDLLHIRSTALSDIATGHVSCLVELPDWNIRKGKAYKIHWGEEGPYIYSDKPWTVDRIDLWTLGDKLKYFDWIE